MKYRALNPLHHMTVRITGVFASLRDRFGSAMACVLVGRMAFLVMIFSASHIATPRDFGMLMLTLNISQVLAFACMFGTGPASQVIISEARALGKSARILSFIKFSILATAIGSAACATAMLALSHMVIEFTGKEDFADTLLSAALFTPVMAFSSLREFVSRSFGDVFLTFAPRDIIWSIVFTIAIYLVPHSSRNIILIATLSLAMVEAVCAWEIWRRKVRALALTPALPFKMYRYWIQRSIAMMLNFVGSFAFERVDSIAIGAFSGLSQAGVYAVASRIAPTIAISQRFVVPMITSRIAKHISSGDYASARTNIKYGVLASVILSLPLLLIIELFSPMVMAHFGSHDKFGGSVLRILSIAFFINSIGLTFGSAVTTFKDYWAFSRIIYPVLLFYSLTLLFITPKFGAIGVATTLVGAMIGYNSALILISFKTISGRRRQESR